VFKTGQRRRENSVILSRPSVRIIGGATTQKKETAMQLTFLPIRLDFNPHTHAVHLVGKCDGRNVGVIVSRDAIELLARTEDLDKDTSVTIVVKNKNLLAHAAEIALAPFGDDCQAVIVEFSHLAVIDSVMATNRRNLACST
jgi:hypothetical protein